MCFLAVIVHLMSRVTGKFLDCKYFANVTSLVVLQDWSFQEDFSSVVYLETYLMCRSLMNGHKYTFVYVQYISICNSNWCWGHLTVVHMYLYIPGENPCRKKKLYQKTCSHPSNYCCYFRWFKGHNNNKVIIYSGNRDCVQM